MIDKKHPEAAEWVVRDRASSLPIFRSCTIHYLLGENILQRIMRAVPQSQSLYEKRTVAHSCAIHELQCDNLLPRACGRVVCAYALVLVIDATAPAPCVC